MASFFLPAAPGKPIQDTSSLDAKESSTVTFEWTLRGLKNLFESSKGDAKSKVTKSPKFGDGRWQIMFYANSGIIGTEGQTFVSLYLGCEPTIAEKESGVNGKWERQGRFNFSFEIRSLSRIVQFNMKEAHEHSFYYPGAQNWGWAQFARRDAIMQHTTIRQNDALIIICSLTSIPAPPTPVAPIPRHPVPRDLLDTIGSLLDDPVYSDVEFILPQRRKTEARKIYASRKLLRRVEYFDDMFNSGFAEGSSYANGGLDFGGEVDLGPPDDASVSDMTAYVPHFDDSDFEDDDDTPMLDNDHEPGTELDQRRAEQISEPMATDEPVPQAIREEEASAGKRRAVSDDGLSEGDQEDKPSDGDAMQSQRNIRPKLSHPSSPRSRDTTLETEEAAVPSALRRTASVRASDPAPEVPGPKKVCVVVRDVAYTTYRAVLYYLYTDMIVFAPLSSTFLTISSSTSAPPGTSVVSTPSAVPLDSQSPFGLPGAGSRANQQQPSETAASSSSTLVGPKTRKDWVAEWMRNNPGRPQPPSAKSVYRLADRLGLQELKERAFQHIEKSLTIENVTYEAFSAFTAAFEDVRKVEVKFMCDHWLAVRKGSLTNIGQQLRLGKLPGFEEVWPLIVQNLIVDDKRGEQDTSRT
ncbi:hypothetical protein C8Q73DRAFT_653179 [Cubamyces lactineus]|nr:hypothetical protein C8Q73DRAFT_653179 [Cubamyces lactineus]